MATKAKAKAEHAPSHVQFILDTLTTGLRVDVETRLNTVVDEVRNDLIEQLSQMESRIAAAKHVTVTTERGTHEVKGQTHKQFPRLLDVVATQLPVLMVGTAGSGKTFAAEQVAEAMTLDFYAMSVGSQTAKSDIVGYMSATGTYVPTAFRTAYEQGGVFLMDELDAGNPNVLIILNSALSSTFCAFPDQMVRRHPDFYFIGTANTYGTGASRQYVGRNQIDAATLDRFVLLDWEVDEDLEAANVAHFDHGKRWHHVVTTVRKLIATEGYRLIASPRATVKGAHLLNSFDLTTTIESVLLSGATEDQREKIIGVARTAWDASA